MAFALTQFLYPLESEIIISKKFNYKLDNPRSRNEVQLVKEYLKKVFKECDSPGVVPMVGRVIGPFYEVLKKRDLKPISNIPNGGIKEDAKFKYLAENWIIIRFSVDNDAFDSLDQGLVKFRKKAHSTLFDLNSSFKNLRYYCSIVSLLAHDDERYFGHSFLLTQRPYGLIYSGVNDYNLIIDFALQNIGHRYDSLWHEEQINDWLLWPQSSDNLLNVCNDLDALFDMQKVVSKLKKQSQKQTPVEKFLHVGKILSAVFDQLHADNEDVMFLLSVTVLEYLLTRNPDSNKFNVEDSIKKQFVAKVGAVVHSADPSYDLLLLEKYLSNIYDKRSDIAHGNYPEKTYDFGEEQLQIMVLKFVKYVCHQYLKDKAFVEFLKDS